MMGAGSGGSADASSQEILQTINNFLGIYSQYEMNQKVKQETETKINILKERLNDNSVSPTALNLLKGVLVSAERNDF